MTKFEELGIEYMERDGLFYPVLSVSSDVVKQASVGKYGRMWMAFMEGSHPDRFRNLIRFGRIYEKAVEIDKEAHELLELIERKWLNSHKPRNGNSFAEMYRLRINKQGRTGRLPIIMNMYPRSHRIWQWRLSFRWEI